MFQYTDALIGATTIDLEDRLYGLLRKQVNDSLEIQRTDLNNRIKKLKKKVPPNKQKMEKCQQMLDDVMKQIATMKQIDAKPTPVEFRDLRHPNKQQSQGIIEMWVEVLTFEEARRIPMDKLKSQIKEEYEIRLIIWETKEVPLINGDTVDIFLKVTFDPSGWSKDIVEKQTDTHYGSNDGFGEFNYRMKFNLETPCSFPRLMFSIYDHRMFTDEAIGQSIIELKDTVIRLLKQGKIESEMLWITFTHPNRRDEPRG